MSSAVITVIEFATSAVGVATVVGLVTTSPFCSSAGVGVGTVLRVFRRGRRGASTWTGGSATDWAAAGTGWDISESAKSGTVGAQMRTPRRAANNKIWDTETPRVTRLVA